MLELNRRNNEKIRIGDDIHILVRRKVFKNHICDNSIHLIIIAPKDIKINRCEKMKGLKAKTLENIKQRQRQVKIQYKKSRRAYHMEQSNGR